VERLELALGPVVKDPSLAAAVSRTACALALGAEGSASPNSPLDPRAVACVLLGLAAYREEPVPTPIRASADTPALSVAGLGGQLSPSSSSSTVPPSAFPLSPSSASSSSASASSSSSSSPAARREERRAAYLKGDVFAACMQSAGKALGCDAHAVSLRLGAAAGRRKTVAGLSRGSAVLGPTDPSATITISSTGAVIEDCTDATIFVTSSVPFLVVRRCRRCTIVAAPSSGLVHVEDSSHTVVSAAARLVVVRNCSTLHLFTWASSPVDVQGDVRDVAVGPYNVAAQGLLTETGLGAWQAKGTCAAAESAGGPAVGAGGAAAAAGSSTAPGSASGGSAVRTMTADELYARRLPVGASLPDASLQTLPAFTAAAASSGAGAAQTAAALEAVAKGSAQLDCKSAKTAEMLAQAAFVVRSSGSGRLG
jgi:hypothetical protein